MRVATYDLGVAWEWEYDVDFMNLLEEACLRHGVAWYAITPRNLGHALAALAGGSLGFRVYFDRASDSNSAFVPLTVQARALTPVRLNDFAHARRAWDKATMHLEFLDQGIQVPYTIILPPYEALPNMAQPDLSPLGSCSYLKPARGGGGEGVQLVTSWPEIQARRQQFPYDKYLLSAVVTPAELTADGSRQAWFRVIYAGGEVFPSWWDVNTHVYTPLALEDETRLGLAPLRQLTRRIAEIAHLELFSTEVALTAEGRYVAVDYVNDPCDLRLQSRAPEAVPDGIVREVAEALACWIAGKTDH